MAAIRIHIALSLYELDELDELDEFISITVLGELELSATKGLIDPLVTEAFENLNRSQARSRKECILVSLAT